MLTAEQIMASHKAFEGVEKLVELNVQATKAALAETANHTQAVMGVKDAQELLALQAGLVQPLAEKTVAYSRHLYDIASAAGADLGKTFEAQGAESQKKFMGLVDNAAKNAPAGSETAVAVMKSAVAAANNAFESMQKAVKQATDMAETNMNTVAASAVSATKTAARKR
ncbi:MAG: phasin family protein [Haliea sp.]|nr:MAG: phasin family protein [Haliea sp.]